MSESERIGFALDPVDAISPNAEALRGWRDGVWTRTRGSAATDFYKGPIQLAVPHVAWPEGRILFAGEHTSVWIGGWMQGALESGDRVALEVNAAVS